MISYKGLLSFYNGHSKPDIVNEIQSMKQRKFGIHDHETSIRNPLKKTTVSKRTNSKIQPQMILTTCDTVNRTPTIEKL